MLSGSCITNNITAVSLACISEVYSEKKNDEEKYRRVCPQRGNQQAPLNPGRGPGFSFYQQ